MTTANGLPPIHIGEAMDLYAKLRDVGAPILRMVDPRAQMEWLETAAAAIVLLGDRLLENNRLIENLTESNAEIDRLLRAQIERHLGPEEETMTISEPGEELTGVAWVGASKDYFDHFAEINKDLAKNVSAMAAETLRREEAQKRHPSAIEALGVETDLPEGLE